MQSVFFCPLLRCYYQCCSLSSFLTLVWIFIVDCNPSLLCCRRSRSLIWKVSPRSLSLSHTQHSSIKGTVWRRRSSIWWTSYRLLFLLLASKTNWLLSNSSNPQKQPIVSMLLGRLFLLHEFGQLIMSLGFITKITDNAATASNDFAGFAILVELAETSPFA